MSEVLSLPKSILDAAVAHVQHKYAKEIERHGIEVDPTRLIDLYHEIKAHQRSLNQLMKQDSSVRVAVSFRVMRSSVLDRHFPERNAKEQQERRIISSALGKIAAELRKLRAQTPQPRTVLDRLKDHVTIGPDGRQYRFST